MFSKKYDIVSIGSSTRDVFLRGEQYDIVKDEKFTTGQGVCFGVGSKIEIKKLAFSCGGGGANAAVTFARQGLKTACVGVVGDDFNGRELITALEREGVDTKFYQRHGDDFTAYSAILVYENGERTILSYKGEGQHFNVKNIPFNKINTKWLYLDSLGGHYDLLETAVKWASENKVKLASNPGGKELEHGLEKWKPLLKNFSILAMNQEEAARFTGIDYKDEEKIFNFMDGLIDGIFIMTKGQNGSVVSDGKKIYRAGIPVQDVIERTGAGDAFNSAFVSEYIRSGDIVKAIQLGTANSTSVVMQYGPQAGILKKGDMGRWPIIKVEASDL